MFVTFGALFYAVNASFPRRTVYSEGSFSRDENEVNVLPDLPGPFLIPRTFFSEEFNS